MATKPYFGLRGPRLDVAIFIVAGVDLLLFGYDQGVMGGLLTLPSFGETFPDICTTADCVANMTNAQVTYRSLIQGVSVSSYNLGCFIGSLITIPIGDKLGRRKMILIGSSTMTIGAILQCSSFSLPQLIVGRLFTGMGCGINTSTVPVWQSECSKSHRRGQTVMAELSIVIFGVALSYWLDFGFSYIDGPVSWRFPIAFQLVFALFAVASIMRMPESPRWLVLKDRNEEAVEVLAALHDLPIDDEYIISQLHAIRVTVHASAKGSFKALFTGGKNKNFQRTLLAYGVQVLQQLTGVNLITYYAATIYETEIGLSGFVARILAACNGTEYFLATFPAIFLVERVGRRPLLITGSIGMAISMIILAVMNKIGGTGPGIVAATFLFVFNTFFALGWCGLPWLIPTELVPLEIRAQANALATSADWIFNFMVVMITPVAFASIGWRTYLIFAVFNAVTAPVIYFFYPETACRSLEEMDLIFTKSTGFFDTVSVAQQEPNHFGRHGEVLIDMLPEVAVNFSDKEAIQHDEEVQV